MRDIKEAEDYNKPFCCINNVQLAASTSIPYSRADVPPRGWMINGRVKDLYAPFMGNGWVRSRAMGVGCMSPGLGSCGTGKSIYIGLMAYPVGRFRHWTITFDPHEDNLPCDLFRMCELNCCAFQLLPIWNLLCVIEEKILLGIT